MVGPVFYPLESITNLHDGYREVFDTGSDRVLLIQEKGQRYILQADCPHAQWSLQNAPITGNTITCTHHGWSFSLTSGKGVNERAGSCKMEIYSVHSHNSMIGFIQKDSPVGE